MGLKGDLLDKYARRKPSTFWQFDGFTGISDEYAGEDGDLLCNLQTWELMDGPEVRVLIKSGTDAVTAAKALEKIHKAIERDGQSWPDPPRPTRRKHNRTFSP